LVLAVIDSLKPEMLDRAIEEGRAPALAKIVERSEYVRDCVSSYPSVTPVASATIATGTGPDRHHIPSMNWYHRGEGRYVEYGSSFQATRAFGIFRSLHDTVYNMNLAHLSRETKTVFEHLDDAGVRTACTTYLIYRGRHRHAPDRDGAYARLARAAQFRHAVWGPRELFYADIFSSRRTDCRSTLGLPGQRDQHAGCIGAHLVENDLFDFLLLSLPDNDSFSHRRGPYAQVTSIATADRALQRVMDAGGGPEAFLDDHTVIVMSDHSQTSIDEQVDLVEVLDDWRVLGPDDPEPEDARLAVSPSARSGMVYVLQDDGRRRETAARLATELVGAPGADLVARLEEGWAVVGSDRGELRFQPGEGATDLRHATWRLEGENATLGLSVDDGIVSSEDYPDALGRLWSALRSPHAGEVLVSAAPGVEYLDWGGASHVGGGSHGSLHRGDSLGVLLLCGTGPGPAPSRQWTLADVTPLILRHFSLPS
jgi:type I phosphodiesterase/nucleotide pyrophosphatase